MMRPTVSMPVLLTIEELSDYIQCPVSTIYQWRHRGQGPRGLTVGRLVRFKAEDVNAWLDSHVEDRDGDVAEEAVAGEIA